MRLFTTVDETFDEFQSGGSVVFGAHADFDGDGDVVADGIHAANDLFEFGLTVQESGASSCAVHEIYGAAAVEVDETQVRAERCEDLSGFHRLPRFIGGDLSTEFEVTSLVVVLND